MTDARFLVALLTDGALAGAIYALVALAFVVVYKASRVVNFALGDWVMLASRLVALGLHGLGLGLAGAVAFGCASTVAVAMAFNRVVLERMVSPPAISLIMVTIGLGMLMRGAVAVALAGVPGGIRLPFPEDLLTIQGLPVVPDKLIAGVTAAAGICALSAFFYWTRTGLALRALASDPKAAMVVGISAQRHFAIAWALMAALAVLAGTLWSAAVGGGFSLLVLGTKVFPIVIIGGLDSIPGTIVAALGIGILESLSAGYLDPWLGAGFSTIVSYVAMLLILSVRPHGLFGNPEIQRI